MNLRAVSPEPTELFTLLFKRLATAQSLQRDELLSILGELNEFTSFSVLQAASDTLISTLERVEGGRNVYTAAQVDDCVRNFIQTLPPFAQVFVPEEMRRSLQFAAKCMRLPLSEHSIRDAARSSLFLLTGVDARTTFQPLENSQIEGSISPISLDIVQVEAARDILLEAAKRMPTVVMQAALLCLPVLMSQNLPRSKSDVVFNLLITQVNSGPCVTVWGAGLAASPGNNDVVTVLVKTALSAASAVQNGGPPDPSDVTPRFSFAWPLLFEVVRSAPVLIRNMLDQEGSQCFDELLSRLSDVIFSPISEHIYAANTLSALPLLLIELLRMNYKHQQALESVAKLLLLPNAERTLSRPIPTDAMVEVLAIFANTPLESQETSSMLDILTQHCEQVAALPWSPHADANDELAQLLKAKSGVIVNAMVWTLLHYWRLNHPGGSSEHFSSHAEIIQRALLDPATRSVIDPMLRKQPAPLLSMFASPHRGMRVASAAILSSVLGMSSEALTDMMKTVHKNESSKPSNSVVSAEDLFFHRDQSTASVESTVGRKNTRMSHFTTIANALQSVIDKNDGAVGEIREVISSSAEHKPGQQPKRGRLVDTETTRLNVQMILDAAENNVPLLLEGSSGVGKTATVQEAADRMGVRLLRYNLSSHTGIDDIMTRVTVKPDPNNSGAVVVGLHLQPFAEAFSEGHWLLFDEFNLAPNSVLMCIKEALDSGIYVVSHPSDPDFKPLIRHENFRLFACQNPASGFFKAKREPLSTVLLSRFNPVVFTELPRSDWIEIVRRRLNEKGFNSVSPSSNLIADHIVAWHFAFNGAVNATTATDGTPFPEVTAYTQTSLRDVLKLVDFVEYILKAHRWGSVRNQWKLSLAEAASAVYIARLHKAQARQIMRELMAETLSISVSDLEMELPVVSLRGSDPRKLCICGVTATRFSGPDSTMAVIPDSISEAEAKGAYYNIVQQTVTETGKSRLSDAMIDSAISAHLGILRILFTPAFVIAHGVCDVSDATLRSWVGILCRDAITDPQQAGKVAAELYCDQQRHISAQREICSIIARAFVPHARVDERLLLDSLQAKGGGKERCALNFFSFTKFSLLYFYFQSRKFFHHSTGICSDSARCLHMEGSDSIH